MLKEMPARIKEEIQNLFGSKSQILKFLKDSFKKTAALKPSTKTTKKYQKKISNLLSLLVERWRFFSLIFLAFFGFYYGLGAIISSKIHNSLDTELKTTETSPHYIPVALTHVLKTQLDDTAWTPALPAIFPAAILDNLPNFQIGSKETVRYITKRLAKHYNNRSLKDAAELLNYPANIWLFSRINGDEIAPGSAKQYRKAITKISDFAKNHPIEQLNTNECIYLLHSLNNHLQKQINKLTQYVQEHNSETLDFRADDIFYYTQGTAYSSYYILNALSQDYQKLIVNTNGYEHITTALKFLKNAVALAPISVKNAAPEDTYSANHLLYLAFYLSQAVNQINIVRYNITLKSRMPDNDN